VTTTVEGQIEQMLFASTSGLLAADGGPLTDDSLVAVFAESTATVRDRDGDGDAVSYPDDIDIPLVSIEEQGDGAVAGVGAMLVNDGDLVPELEGEDPLGDLGNEEFLLNVYDEYAAGDTVLWDEGHGQFYSLDRFRNFEAYAEDNGYALEPTAELTSDLSVADAVVVTSPADAFTDDELSALNSFVDGGGLVVLHDQSDFSNFDQTANLNAVADGLDLGFRFNDGEVGDTENNVGIGFLPLTTNFNDEFPLFADRPGITIDLRRGRDYDVDIVDVADGDTFDVVFDGEDIGLETDYTATVRVLGIDTPESASVAASAERPEEWEGVAYDIGEPDPLDELVFDSTASLLDASREPLTDDSLVAVYAEPTASNEDSDGNGDSVSYPDDTDIPLVAVDGNVAGLGAPFIAEGFDTTADNEEFLLNLYDELIGSGTVLWDESHGQFYDLASFPEFETYAEQNGYTLEATTDLTGDLSNADAVVVTSPSSAFTDDELTALDDFVDDGGTVILHDQSDFRNFDATANLNEVADALDLGFRFNDDQVVDGENNGGQFFLPATSNFAGPGALFETRVGLDEDPDARTTPYLIEQANSATSFALERLNSESATLFFDENEPLRDPTRLLAYAEYDADGDGQRETLYNREMVEKGYARVYGSTFSKHDEFWALEQDARSDGRELWAESDISAASPYRERDLEEVFFPEAAVLDRDNGRPRPQTVAAYSDPEAARGDQASSKKHPLFGVDSAAGVAVGGALLIDESYERLEGFEVDTSGFANFRFLTDVIEGLSDEGRGDIVFIDGGHGQFGVDYALSNEDAAYYQRHLEGRGITFEQVNNVTLDRLSGARALIVTTPVSEFTPEEAAAVRSFRDDGGAVVLLGSASAPSEPTANLNSLADELGTELRVGDERVTDPANNVANDPEIPTTTDVVASPGPPRTPGRGNPNGRGSSGSNGHQGKSGKGNPKGANGR
jgi:endonuclease YncB( thermonuclease family)